MVELSAASVAAIATAVVQNSYTSTFNSPCPSVAAERKGVVEYARKFKLVLEQNNPGYSLRYGFVTRTAVITLSVHGRVFEIGGPIPYVEQEMKNRLITLHLCGNKVDAYLDHVRTEGIEDHFSEDTPPLTPMGATQEVEVEEKAQVGVEETKEGDV